MSRKIIFIIIALLANVLLSAQRFDANWPLGTNEYPNTIGYGNAILRFQADSVIVEKADLSMNFESASGAISDTLGNLLFFTNGCYIATATGDTMLNGEGLNPGLVHNWVCAGNGYISPRGVMVLPMPGSNHLYYVLHMGVRYESGEDLSFGPFYFSLVDMTLNDGKGKVTSKNNILADGQLEPFAVTRHGNGRDWWIIVPEYHSNRYRRYIVTVNAIIEMPPIDIGSSLSCLRIGSSTFALDGRRFARQQNCKSIVFDFDRCTGNLSNPLELSRPQHAFGGGGVAFSPDGNYLFTTEQLAILSANLQLPNPELDTLVNTEAITGAGLNFLQYRPDGNSILVNILHRSRFFSSLDSINSNLPTFKQQSVTLPVYNVRTLPYFPNFRLYDLPNSVCDSLGINSPTSVSQLANLEAVKIFPNPFLETISVHTELATSPITFILYDQLGTVLLRQTTVGNAIIQTQHLPSGLYFWSVEMEGRMVRRGKCVKG